MTTKRYVALLRGINVGGKNTVAMSDLRDAFEAARVHRGPDLHPVGQRAVRVRRAAKALEADLETMLEKRFGVPLVVVVRSHRQFRPIVDKAPTGFGDHPTSTTPTSSS